MWIVYTYARNPVCVCNNGNFHAKTKRTQKHALTKGEYLALMLRIQGTGTPSHNTHAQPSHTANIPIKNT